MPIGAIVGGIKALGAATGATKAIGAVTGFLKANPWVGTAASYGMQRRDANRAHQRQMHDLRKAGINPILSAKLGGAQTPQMGDMGQTMNTARQIDQTEKLTDAQVQQIDEAINKLDAEIAQIEHGTVTTMQKNEITNMILKVYRKFPELPAWKETFKGTTPKDWLSSATFTEYLELSKNLKDVIK